MTFISETIKNPVDSWQLVDEVMNSFIRQYPEKWINFCNYMDNFRKTRFNSLGSSLDSKGLVGDMQHVCKFPSDPMGNNISDQLEKIMPDICTDEKKLFELLRRWPQLKACEKL